MSVINFIRICLGDKLKPIRFIRMYIHCVVYILSSLPISTDDLQLVAKKKVNEG